MTTEPLDDDYRMPLNPKPRYCSQCDNEVGEDETLCLVCREDAEDAGAVWQDKELYGRTGSRDHILPFDEDNGCFPPMTRGV